MAILLIQHDRFLRHDFSQHLNQQSKYYQALALGLPCSNVRPLPLITEYGPDQTEFTYSSRLAPENKYRLLYPAALDDMPNSPIIVKFVQRYNADAHRLLAAQGLVPKLHYSSTNDNVRYGKWFMIVKESTTYEQHGS